MGEQECLYACEIVRDVACMRDAHTLRSLGMARPTSIPSPGDLFARIDDVKEKNKVQSGFEASKAILKLNSGSRAVPPDWTTISPTRFILHCGEFVGDRL